MLRISKCDRALPNMYPSPQIRVPEFTAALFLSCGVVLGRFIGRHRRPDSRLRGALSSDVNADVHV